MSRCGPLPSRVDRELPGRMPANLEGSSYGRSGSTSSMDGPISVPTWLPASIASAPLRTARPLFPTRASGLAVPGHGEKTANTSAARPEQIPTRCASPTFRRDAGERRKLISGRAYEKWARGNGTLDSVHGTPVHVGAASNTVARQQPGAPAGRNGRRPTHH